jgi:CMP-N-acetylneuraminic acid synthetase
MLATKRPHSCSKRFEHLHSLVTACRWRNEIIAGFDPQGGNLHAEHSLTALHLQFPPVFVQNPTICLTTSDQLAASQAVCKMMR